MNIYWSLPIFQRKSAQCRRVLFFAYLQDEIRNVYETSLSKSSDFDYILAYYYLSVHFNNFEIEQVLATYLIKK